FKKMGRGDFLAKARKSTNLIFRYLTEGLGLWLSGRPCTIGFDKYVNLVLDDAEEIFLGGGAIKQLGRIMLKGDNITLLQSGSGNGTTRNDQ
uniref:Small nuclear ribonucleoprotein E n=1 Tax=Spermophilus dauricus TaxID=99837 RepID=A0A8C9USF0_SPEDA